jgi:ketosteroid isomerase-like protein
MTRINDPHTLAEFTAVFERYEAALVANDVPTLDALFWQSPEVVRYGVNEHLYGFDEIAAFRAARPSAGLKRTITRRSLTTIGYASATAHVEFQREGQPRTGRQTQAWVKFEDGNWRVVSAHVSLAG